MGLSGAKRLVNEFDIHSTPRRRHACDHHTMEMTVEHPGAQAEPSPHRRGQQNRRCTPRGARLAQLQELARGRCAGRVAIVATELANNLLQHGGGGELLLQSVEADDAPPGRNNGGRPGPRHEPLRPLPGGRLFYRRHHGHRTRRGAAAVIGVRSVFDAGAGHRRSMARVGVRHDPAPGRRQHCGQGRDRMRRQLAAGPTVPRATALLVVDGLGHGPFAAQAAHGRIGMHSTARRSMRRSSSWSACTAHSPARAVRRPPVRASIRAGACRYAGVGNIHGALLSRGWYAAAWCRTTARSGVRVPRMHQFEYQRPKGALLVMHSDGVSARWNLACPPGSAAAAPGGRGRRCCIAIMRAPVTMRPWWSFALAMSAISPTTRLAREQRGGHRRFCAPSSRRPTAAWSRCTPNWMTRRSSCDEAAGSQEPLPVVHEPRIPHAARPRSPA